MGLALKVYDVFSDDKDKATILAEVIEAIEQALPHKDDLVTNSVLTERAMELKFEIEKTRKETREIESNLKLEISKVESNLKLEISEVESNLKLEMSALESNLKLEIEKTRKETREIESNLKLEISKVESNLKLEISGVEKNLSIAIAKSQTELVKYINRHTIWTIGAISVIIGALKALDYVLK